MQRGTRGRQWRRRRINALRNEEGRRGQRAKASAAAALEKPREEWKVRCTRRRAVAWRSPTAPASGVTRGADGPAPHRVYAVGLSPHTPIHEANFNGGRGG